MNFVIILVLLGIASTVHCLGKDSILLAIENYIETTNSKFRESCIQESGVDRALVDKLEGAEVTDNEHLKCYIRCQATNSKVVDDQGIINITTLQAVIKATNNEFIDKVEKDCKFPVNPHLCEAAYETLLCIWDILHNHHHIH